MTDSGGLATRPWIAWFTTLGKLFGFNQTIQADGVAVPGQVTLNFLPPFTVTDDPTNGTTDIGLGSAIVQTDVTTGRALGTIYTADVAKAVSVQCVLQVAGGDSKIQPMVGDGSPTTKIGGNTASTTVVGGTVAAFFLVQEGFDYVVNITGLTGAPVWAVDSWVEWPI